MLNRLKTENPQETINEIYKLNVKIRKLENGIESYLGNGRNISNDILNKCLIELRDFAKLRIVDIDKLRRRVFDVKSKVLKMKLSIENLDPSDECVSSIKSEMELIEALISELKHEQKDNYETLLRSEINLWQECVFMEKKIDSWELGDHENYVEQPIKNNKILETNLQKPIQNMPVVALQKFLDETGGKTGRWSTIDHQTFLRIRLRYTKIVHNDEVTYPRDEETFFRDLASLLAPKSIAEIEDHELWYQKYQELVVEKKKFIAKWKEEKSRQETLEVEPEIEDTTRTTTSRTDWEKEKIRLEKKRQELDAWRTEKAMEEYRVKSEKEKAEKEEIERRKKEEEKQRLDMRRQVELYKQRRLETEAEKCEYQFRLKEYDELMKRQELEQHSARINERNTRMVEERILKKHQKQIEEENRQERLKQLRNKVSVTAERDPLRLLKPTAGWSQKLADGETGGGGNLSATMRINNVQHRAVPSWRRDNP